MTANQLRHHICAKCGKSKLTRPSGNGPYICAECRRRNREDPYDPGCPMSLAREERRATLLILERRLDVLAEHLRRVGEVHDAALIREAVQNLQELRKELGLD